MITSIIMEPEPSLRLKRKNRERYSNIFSFRKRIVYTCIVICIIFVFLSVPLIGVTTTEGMDSLFVFRSILGSKQGSLLEFGILPIVLASGFTLMLKTLKEKKVKVTKDDESNFQIISCIMIFCFTQILALAFLFGGVYGEVFSFVHNLLIYAQFFFVGVALGLLNWLFKKRIGFGSLITWMIISSVSFNIFNGMFSLRSEPAGGFAWYRGCVLAFFQGLFKDPIDVATPFSRAGRSPDLLGLLALIVVFSIVIYVSAITINLPSNKKPKKQGKGIFHNLEKPLLLTTTVFSLIYLTSNLIYQNLQSPYRSYFLVRFFGNWDYIDAGQTQLAPISGLAVYTTPPYGPEQIALYPVNAIIYLLFITVICGIFSWLYINKLQNWNKKSEGSALFRGLLLGFLTGSMEFLGPLGTGTGIVLTILLFKKVHTEISLFRNKK